ncbi:hypothetical protein ABT364_10590 [Massilia sp. SR12]
MFKLLFAALFLGLTASSNAIAHVDTLLPIRADGMMADLPSNFGPGKLAVNFSSPSARRPSVSSVVLQLRGRQIELPKCVTSLLRTKSMKEVVAAGSWYHDEAMLPYYLQVTFFNPGYSAKLRANSGVQILFNLRTGDVIEIHALVVGDKGRSVRNFPVDLNARCTADEAAKLASR